jgi:hypothetical protein
LKRIFIAPFSLIIASSEPMREIMTETASLLVVGGTRSAVAALETGAAYGHSTAGGNGGRA